MGYISTGVDSDIIQSVNSNTQLDEFVTCGPVSYFIKRWRRHKNIIVDIYVC